MGVLVKAKCGEQVKRILRRTFASFAATRAFHEGINFLTCRFIYASARQNLLHQIAGGSAAAIAGGAAALGLVSSMPSGPGVVDEATIARITAIVPPPVATFLLTSLHDADAIIAQQRRCRTNTLQLCDYVELSVYARLRAALPGIALVQVIHVTGEESVGHARKVAEHVDAILLDSGNPALTVKELGGTGRVHDWSLSRRIRDAVDKPLFLAGGLRSTNVREAIAAMQPFGLDLCSGVRTNDILDESKFVNFLPPWQVGPPPTRHEQNSPIQTFCHQPPAHRRRARTGGAG